MKNGNPPIVKNTLDYAITKTFSEAEWKAGDFSNLSSTSFAPFAPELTTFYINSKRLDLAVYHYVEIDDNLVPGADLDEYSPVRIA